MACQVTHKLRLLRPVQWFFTILVITICSHAKPCTCSRSSNHYRNASYTWNTSFLQMKQGLLFLLDDNSAAILQQSSLGSYMLGSPHPGFNLTDSGWFLIPNTWFDPWKMSQGEIDLNQTVSFSIVFTLSTVSTINPLLFDILPILEPPDDGGTPLPTRGDFVQNLTDTLNINFTSQNTTSQSRKGIRVTATFSSSMSTYSMRIDYDRAAHNLSVYLVRDADVGTTTATMQLDAGETLTLDALLFAITSSMGQLLKLYNWNFTITVRVTEQSRGANTATIVSSVLGSAAATAAIAAAVYFYLNSKYRRWKKDLDKLAKTMQSLPGVPMQVDIADIKKATNNFHETMRLGQGGFGTVYMCKLPAPKKGELMEVAVKKFTRADNRGYEDFLAEVSIINRLRHKNIVPLVGWSYNRGEPILIYEYMPNGSLDQHLFPRTGDELQGRTCMSQWGTRYNLVKDIATGLQYVHHEYEPMVLHRDIKASNIMIDFTFQGRLGDFGLACVLANGKESYTDYGAPGTLGFRAPEYVYNGKATRKTDIFAFGVLVLEIVTGKRAVSKDVQFGHVTDWVWNLHTEGNLLAAVDHVLTTTSEFDADEAIRLLQLGMACSSPNPSDRPNMVGAVQIINKSVPPPDIPLSKPPFVWPPGGWESSSSTSDYSMSTSNFNTTSTFMVGTTAGSEPISSEHEHSRFTSYTRRNKIFAGGHFRLSL